MEDLALKNNSLALDNEVAEYRKKLDGVNHNFTKLGTSGQYQSLRSGPQAAWLRDQVKLDPVQPLHHTCDAAKT